MQAQVVEVRQAVNPHQDRVLRDSFLAAVAKGDGSARQWLPLALRRPWLTDAGYFPLAELALGIVQNEPQQARQILLIAARAFPAIALRECAAYAGLPFGGEIFAEAAEAAPDEAAALAAGNSLTSAAVRAQLAASSRPELQVLSRLAAGHQEAGAIFFHEIAAHRMSASQAVEAASSSRFFAAVCRLRLAAPASEAATYDRVLEKYAEVLFRAAQNAGSPPSAELARLTASEVYLLLVYGRSEEDDLLFGAIFDRYLVPKLHATPAARLLDEVHGLYLRRFLAAAAAHHRLSAFASAAVLKRAVEGIDKEERPLDEALSLAEVIEGVTERGPLEALKSSILSEYRRQSDAQALYGLLATALSRKLANNPELGPIATSYAAFFKEPRSLDVASLYRMGECVQAQFFYDDDDANESFASFEALYKRDKNWTFTNHGWYVEARRSANGRTIRVFANVPFAPGAPNTEDRRIGLVKLLNAQKLTPTVVIHRGHTWYVNQSLRYLTPETRLVYLGSCRGMENVYTVLAVSNRAQMIATRGVGTQTVNDPLLKSLNDELLTGIDSLDWDRFWHAMSSRLSASEFRDYVAPPRNASAILLAAYYDSISSPPAKQLPPQQTDSQPDRQIHQ